MFEIKVGTSIDNIIEYHYIDNNDGGFCIVGDIDSNAKRLKYHAARLNTSFIKGMEHEGNCSFIYVNKPSKDITNGDITNGDITHMIDKMPSGGIVYLKQFNNEKVIVDFLTENHKTIYCAQQKTINGIKEEHLLIKYNGIAQHPKLDMVTAFRVVCVLKSGGRYDISHVNMLANAVRENVHFPYFFICLTDFEDPQFNNNVDDVVPLIGGFEGDWSKLELFRSKLFSTTRILYLDLGVMVLNNITDLMFSDYPFIGIRDFNQYTTMSSAVMSWNPYTMLNIYDYFAQHSEYFINSKLFPSDQEVIYALTANHVKYYQDLDSLSVVWFDDKKAILDETKIVCFQGSSGFEQLENYPLVKNYIKRYST